MNKFQRGDLVSWPYPTLKHYEEIIRRGGLIRTYGVVMGWRSDIDAYEMLTDIGTYWCEEDKLQLIWRIIDE